MADIPSRQHPTIPPPETADWGGLCGRVCPPGLADRAQSVWERERGREREREREREEREREREGERREREREREREERERRERRERERVSE